MKLISLLLFITLSFNSAFAARLDCFIYDVSSNEEEAMNNSLWMKMFAYFDEGTNDLYDISFRYKIKNKDKQIDEILFYNVESYYHGKKTNSFSYIDPVTHKKYAYNITYDEFILLNFSNTVNRISFRISEDMFNKENYHKSTTAIAQFYDGDLNSLGTFSLSCGISEYKINRIRYIE